MRKERSNKSVVPDFGVAFPNPGGGAILFGRGEEGEGDFLQVDKNWVDFLTGSSDGKSSLVGLVGVLLLLLLAPSLFSGDFPLNRAATAFAFSFGDEGYSLEDEVVLFFFFFSVVNGGMSSFSSLAMIHSYFLLRES